MFDPYNKSIFQNVNLARILLDDWMLRLIWAFAVSIYPKTSFCMVRPVLKMPASTERLYPKIWDPHYPTILVLSILLSVNMPKVILDEW